jgi:hypothetical protein
MSSQTVSSLTSADMYRLKSSDGAKMAQTTPVEAATTAGDASILVCSPQQSVCFDFVSSGLCWL